AVGFCLDDIADAEGSGRTALVVDDDRLSKRLGNLDLQRPGHDVGVSPGRERHDDGDWSRRIGLRHRGRHAADKDAKRNCQKHHVNSPIASADFYLGPPHSITSSAATSSLSGTVSPSGLAVLRLRVVSYFVGACSGRAAGLAQGRMGWT